MTNAHLERYKAWDNIQTSRGTNFKNVIAKIFPEAEVSIRQKWVTKKIYYETSKPSAFSNLKKL